MVKISLSSEIKLIDSHAHAQFAAYDADRGEVMRRALENGVGIINVGTLFSTSLAAVRLAEKYKHGVWATVGFHPGHAGESSHHDPWELAEESGDIFDYRRFLELAKSPKVVAVGECGLDYYRIKNYESRIKEKQEKVFVEQIELALEIGKPLTIHCRPSAGSEDAYDDAFRILNSYFLIHNSSLRGVMHFFVGSPDTAKKFLDFGFYISFAGPITFASEYEDVVRSVPIDRILVETDAPYASPAPYRGKRNEPLYVCEVAKKIAALKGILYDKVVWATTENAVKLFGLEA